MRILIGIAIGGTLAMIFPEQAAMGYEFVREHVNTLAWMIAERTN